MSQTNTMTSAAFAFVGVLAADMNSGEFELPSWPAAVTQIKQALEDENTNVGDLVRLIGTEPVLAARILKMANSAFMGSKRPVSDVKSAVNRLGFVMVRNQAISLAMSQMFEDEVVADIKASLESLWVHSTMVSALAYLLAKRVPGVNPDEAYLAGLVHDMGKLYVYRRAQSHKELFDSTDSLNEIVSTWHTSIGKAIVESWSFPDALAEAVGDHEEYDRESDEPASLTDVLALANLLANGRRDDSGNEVALEQAACFGRIGLSEEDIAEMVLEVDYEVQTMRPESGD